MTQRVKIQRQTPKIIATQRENRKKKNLTPLRKKTVTRTKNQKKNALIILISPVKPMLVHSPIGAH
jgi:hypothetical protein